MLPDVGFATTLLIRIFEKPRISRPSLCDLDPTPTFELLDIITCDNKIHPKALPAVPCTILLAMVVHTGRRPAPEAKVGFTIPPTARDPALTRRVQTAKRDFLIALGKGYRTEWEAARDFETNAPLEKTTLTPEEPQVKC